VHKVWGGRLRSRVHCNSCGANSDTFDTFLDLSLDITPNTGDIRNALKGFAKEDRLEGRNKYKCEKSVATAASCIKEVC
jgi:ubiquitin carboxyl-terminal hydrolase 36/42